MSTLDLLGLVGTILGIGGALDACLRPKLKADISQWLARASSKQSGASYRGSLFLDRIFGPKLFSIRSIAIYIALSVGSIALSYTVAIITTPPEGQKNIVIFPGGVNFLDLLLLFICIAFAAIGDVGSYAQTRLFVRAVDQSKSAIVCAGLALADVVTSMTLFFISFTFARTVCYLIAMQISPASGISSTENYLPSMLASATAAEPNLFKFQGGSGQGFSPFFELASVRAEDDVTPLASLFQKSDGEQLNDKSVGSSVEYSVSKKCLDPSKDIQQFYTVFTSTKHLIDVASALPDSGKIRRVNRESVNKAVQGAARDAYSASGKCPLLVVTVRKTLPFRSLLGMSGFSNILWTASQRTLYDAYMTVGWKLSPYVSFDPYQGLSDYVQNLVAMSSVTFLGIMPVEPDRQTVLRPLGDTFPVPSRSLNVPFSPMVASSLASSVFFLAYLIAVWIAHVRKILLNGLGRILPSFDLDVAVCTSLAVAVSVAALVLYIGLTAFAEIWSMVLR